MALIRTVFVLALAMLLLADAAYGDLYLHFPRGSNDRNRERNDNRNNANRLFDSQNNAAGGYPYPGDPTIDGEPDPVTFYKGSILRIEWTNQHACGPNDNSDCSLIIQYACESDMPGIRDGYPQGALVDSDPNNRDDANNRPYYLRRAFSGTGGQNSQGTARIPDNKPDNFYEAGLAGGQEFGYHESIDWYKTCKKTERNQGLYTADQTLKGTTARFTRQNPNGGRSGLECPEERDYYPYWRPTPFKDAAILTNRKQYCGFFQASSQNVKESFYCDCPSSNGCQNKNIPITEQKCKQQGGSWVEVPAKGIAAPDCRLHSFGRDNHLGNTLEVNEDGELLIGSQTQPETAHYNWVIPGDMQGHCMIRLRYNISTSDYPNLDYKDAAIEGVGFSSAHNCPNVITPDNGNVDDGSGGEVGDNPCLDKLTTTGRPLFNRPYVQLFGSQFAGTPKLGLAINTHQTGRTFQDRSWIFQVTNRPNVAGSRTIWNLGVRGRRGNIVQAYPSVEYDFVPNVLRAPAGDLVHIQFWGSDFNAAKNPNNGEGWRFSDRQNMIQVASAGTNYPEFQTRHTMFPDGVVAHRWAVLNQKGCLEYKDKQNGEQNDRTNCGKLNDAPARFPIDAAEGLVLLQEGTFHYTSTRNNNFSNRSQKAKMLIGPGDELSTAAIIGIVVGCSAAIGLLGAGVMVYGKRNPNTVAGGWYSRFAEKCLNKTHTEPPPQMEYQRQGRL
jgi:hypothetical protein